MSTGEFSEEQRLYLQGFVAGCEALGQSAGEPTFAGTLEALGSTPPQSAGPNDVRNVHWRAQSNVLAAGGKLCAEEQAKRDKDPFQMWDEMRASAAAGKFPKGTDVLLYKYHGLFYVAPAQNSFMCRLRFHGGLTNSYQFCGLANLAERYAGGYVDVTTRANLQLREITAENGTAVVSSLLDLGILNRGAGADNIRNVTGSPTAGIDPQELFDTRPLSAEMHHYVLQHPEMYGLPRKFNIAFDGGGTISALADTNDVGFFAVRVGDGYSVAPGIYFRMELGGITGHADFARDTGVLLKPNECVPLAAAVIQVFSEHGDRADRKKARLKYVLDRMGFDKFLEAVEQKLSFKPMRFPLSQCEPRAAVLTSAHHGFHRQSDPGKFYVGVVLPVGRIRADQVRELARISDQYGSGTIRLTVWQNLLISDIDERHIPEVRRAIEDAGLGWSATNVRSGLVACTGSAGCKFAASNTKGHALQIAEHLEARLELDQPVNIHLTGCHHSCAQHYIGDVGLLATKVMVGEEMVEGYHVYVGGGFGEHREIGRELAKSVPFADVPVLVEHLLLGWQTQRAHPEESFRSWLRSKPLEQLQTLTKPQLAQTE